MSVARGVARQQRDIVLDHVELGQILGEEEGGVSGFQGLGNYTSQSTQYITLRVGSGSTSANRGLWLVGAKDLTRN